MAITIRQNITGLPFSLHDMAVTGFAAEGDRLHMLFEHGFVKITELCEQVDGHIEFDGVDWDFCFAYVFDFVGNAGSFPARKLFLRDFIREFENAISFEIVDETYGYNCSKFGGYLSLGGQIQECMLEVYHAGDMRYVTEG